MQHLPTVRYHYASTEDENEYFDYAPYRPFPPCEIIALGLCEMCNALVYGPVPDPQAEKSETVHNNCLWKWLEEQKIKDNI